jgi:glycine oxidase
VAQVAPSTQRFDAVVVGAGVVGLSCGFELAKRGASVVVIDRSHPGAGASGVAAGMLAPVTEAEFGEEPLLELNLAGARLWPEFEADLAQYSGVATGYSQSGALVVAIDRDDAQQLRRLHDFQNRLGLECEWLSARSCRRLEPGLSPRIAGGVLAPSDHQVDPRKTVSALVQGFQAVGGQLRTGTDVTQIETSHGQVGGVRDSGGAVYQGPFLVMAAGCFSGQIRGLDNTVGALLRPVKGQILRFRGQSAPGLCGRLVRTPRCYVVNRGDGEVVIGATMEERGFDTSTTAGGLFGLLEAGREVLPDVDELEFGQACAGLRPASPDNAPMIGQDGSLDGLIWASGHHRNGVLLAPLTARLVADAIAGKPQSPMAETFSPRRFESMLQATVS